MRTSVRYYENNGDVRSTSDPNSNTKKRKKNERYCTVQVKFQRQTERLKCENVSQEQSV